MKKLNFRPEAVIFDMDGVLIDSMPYHFIAWYEVLRPYNVRVNCFDVYKREGEKWDKSLRELMAGSGVELKKPLIKKIFSERKKIFRKYFKRYIFNGADELIICLKEKGLRLALVTGTIKKEVVRILPARIRNVFDVIVAGDDVRHGKPNPEPYLLAAKKLGVNAAKCVVVENAPYGILSAKRAGMFCIALTTSLPAEFLGRADIITGRIQDIDSLAGKACETRA